MKLPSGEILDEESNISFGNVLLPAIRLEAIIKTNVDREIDKICCAIWRHEAAMS